MNGSTLSKTSDVLIDKRYSLVISLSQFSNQRLVPFCNVLQSTANVQFSCTADHEAVSRCNLVQYTNALPSDYVVCYRVTGNPKP